MLNLSQMRLTWVHQSLREKTETCSVALACLCVCCVARHWHGTRLLHPQGPLFGSCLLEGAARESCSSYVHSFPLRKQMGLIIGAARPLGECSKPEGSHQQAFPWRALGLLGLSELQPRSSSSVAPDRLLRPAGRQKRGVAWVPYRRVLCCLSCAFSCDFKLSSPRGNCSWSGLYMGLCLLKSQGPFMASIWAEVTAKAWQCRSVSLSCWSM